MMSRADVLAWLQSLSEDAMVAINDDGMALVELGAETGLCSMCEPYAPCWKHENYIEVGGVPRFDSDDSDA